MIMLYGFPGAGKTHFARQFCEQVYAAHLQSDRIRYELFEDPRHDQQEDQVISHLMQYMAEEFLKAGVSVVYDMNAMRMSDRRQLRELARKAKAQPILIWFQIDLESAFTRVVKRDRRKADDKYASPLDRTTFEKIVTQMKNPAPTEDYFVVSGKHTFKTQYSAIIKRFYENGLIAADTASAKVVKPGMVNLIPKVSGGRVDNSRRNIVIR